MPYHKFTVTYLDAHGDVREAPITARNDVDAGAVAVSTCEALRAVAEKSARPVVIDRSAYVPLQIFADEREGRVIWTNALFDVLYRSSGAGHGYGVSRGI